MNNDDTNASKPPSSGTRIPKPQYNAVLQDKLKILHMDTSLTIEHKFSASNEGGFNPLANTRNDHNKKTK